MQCCTLCVTPLQSPQLTTLTHKHTYVLVGFLVELNNNGTCVFWVSHVKHTKCQQQASHSGVMLNGEGEEGKVYRMREVGQGRGMEVDGMREGEEEERKGGREGNLDRMREVGGMSEGVGGTREGGR